MMRIFQRRGGASGVRNLQFVAIPLGLCGAYVLWAQGLPLGTAAVGIALACLAWGGRIGLADLVALTGTFWIISTEPGGGWLSSAGYVLLDVVLVAALLKAHGRALRKRFLRRPKLGITRITIQWESGSRFRLDSNHNLPAPPEPVERPSEAKLLN
jgi:hypothetical protein